MVRKIELEALNFWKIACKASGAAVTLNTLSNLSSIDANIHLQTAITLFGLALIHQFCNHQQKTIT